MKLSDELNQWGYHSSLSEEGKKQHLEMADKAIQLEAELDAERSMRHESQSDYGNQIEGLEKLEADNEALREWIGEDELIEMAVAQLSPNEVAALLTGRRINDD